MKTQRGSNTRKAVLWALVLSGSAVLGAFCQTLPAPEASVQKSQGQSSDAASGQSRSAQKAQAFAGEKTPPITRAIREIPRAQADSRAKDLFFEAKPAPSATSSQATLARRFGLRYRITVKDLDGDVRSVTDRFGFSTGDRIQLTFESNIDGYLYLFQKGTSGHGVQLFPDPRIQGGGNALRRYTQLTIPPREGESRGWWKFDPKVGNEELYVVLSPKPIESAEGTRAAADAAEGKWQTVAALTGKSAKSAEHYEYYETSEFESGSRGAEPSTVYVVSSSPVLIHRITLRHGH